MYTVWLMLTKHLLTSGFKYTQNILTTVFSKAVFLLPKLTGNLREVILFHQDHTAFTGNGLS